MSKSLPVFPASKIKEIVMQDPDLKDLPKKAVEMLRVAAEQYVHYVFQKCSEEAKKKKRTTMNRKDFDAAILNDPALKACLGQFYLTDEELENPPKEEPEPLNFNEEEQHNEAPPEEEEIHEDNPGEGDDEPPKQEDFLSDSEEEEKKSEEPSVNQSEMSELEPDPDDV